MEGNGGIFASRCATDLKTGTSIVQQAAAGELALVLSFAHSIGVGTLMQAFSLRLRNLLSHEIRRRPRLPNDLCFLLRRSDWFLLPLRCLLLVPLCREQAPQIHQADMLSLYSVPDGSLRRLGLQLDALAQ
jgi:hypothetical protein